MLSLARCAFLIFNCMKKYDPILTQRVQDWLNTPEENRDITEGATLYLQLSRNRALYNSVLRKPEKFRPKLIYELRKYLRIRLDNMAMSDIVELESRVMPLVEQTIDELPTVMADDEFPEAMVACGRRSDHNSLPDDIKDLWESNRDRYRRIVLLFNELKAMAGAAPCDRYEKLQILAELDRVYRDNLRAYDSYTAENTEPESSGLPSAPSPVPSPEYLTSDCTEDDAEESSVIPPLETPQPAEIARRIGAARKTVSATKKILSELNPDDPRASELRSRIQEAVDTVRTLGGGFADRQQAELADLGIMF